MRISHISPHLPPDQAANAILPAQLGAWQRARGDEVSFVTHAPAQGAHARPADDHLAEIPRRTPGIARLLRLDAIALVGRVERALSKARPQIVHLHSNGLIVEAAARWAR